MSSPPAAVRERLDRAFQVVAGKGGVGRTLVASAIALRASQRGERVLLLEVNAPDSCARFLGVAPAPDEPREVLPNLWLCRMTPAGAMKEYALLILRFKALYTLVFENRLVKYLLRSIPSLAELTMMGKAWYHTTETLDDGSPRYTRVVVDAPATGHAMTFLSLSRIVADVVPPGVLKVAAEKMAALIESPIDSCLHLVALPEEMPVNEALELAVFSAKKLHMATGIGVMNRRLVPFASSDELAAIERARASADPGLATFLETALRRRELESVQADHAARFAAEVDRPVVTFDEMPSRMTPQELTRHAVGWLDEAAGTNRVTMAPIGAWR